MKCSFVIPSYKKTDLIIECLKSIRELYPNDEIIISDDGSGKEVQETLKGVAKVFNAKLICNFWNNGFGHTSNSGIHEASGDLVFLVNDDVIINNDIKARSIELMKKDNKIGLIGYLLFYPDGNIQHGGYKYLGNNYFGHYDHNVPVASVKKAFKERYEIGVTAALWCIRKKMFNEIGGFKSGYGLAFEDVEYCLRVWHNDWKIYYSTKSAIHAEGATRGRTIEEKKSLGFWELEQQSHKQYSKDITKYNIPELIKKVNMANIDNSDKIKLIGIKRTMALGDVLYATGIVEELSIRYPSAKIVVCTKKKYPFENNPKVYKIIDNEKEFQAMFGNKENTLCYDLDMVYENNPADKIWVSYAKHCFDDNYYEPDIRPVLYDKYSSRLDLLTKLSKMNPRLGQKFVIIHAPTSWASRTLSLDIWNEIISYITSRGYKVVICGSSIDQKPPTDDYSVLDFRDKLTLEELRQLMRCSKGFIGTDSGILHIAQTTETNITGIFTVANPAYRIFRWEKTNVVIPKSDCMFCLERRIGITNLSCDKIDCIRSITSDMVIERIKEWL